MPFSLFAKVFVPFYSSGFFRDQMKNLVHLKNSPS
jgi:hypothetical protein